MTDKLNEMVDMMWIDVDANAAKANDTNTSSKLAWTQQKQQARVLAAGSSNSSRQKMTVDRSSPKYRCRPICGPGRWSQGADGRQSAGAATGRDEGEPRRAAGDGDGQREDRRRNGRTP